MAPREKRTPVFLIGIFFGVLMGCFLTLALSTSDTSETYEQYEARARDQRKPATAGRGQQQPSTADRGQAPPGQGHGGPGRRNSVLRVPFMKKFVRALTQMPENKRPNPNYEPLLKDVTNPIVCVDCHDSKELDFEKIKQLEPAAAEVERSRQDPRFMIPLMKKWVKRLNARHAGRLRKTVTCTDCHLVDPQEKFDVYPPLMAAFVNALKRKPTNKNPASRWKPLLKDPSSQAMLCGVCHGDIGDLMERNLARFLRHGRPAKYAEDKTFMLQLMEEWVDELNRKASHLLVKAVVCLDCHETDLRR